MNPSLETILFTFIALALIRFVRRPRIARVLAVVAALGFAIAALLRALVAISGMK